MKKYSIIYADPPWAYRTYSKKGQGRSAESHYPTMCIEDIKALPVGELAAKDCALFLWITFPCLCEALEVLTAWGFSYKTVAFVWVKQNRKNDDLFTGMGYWTRANAEICILATKAVSYTHLDSLLERIQKEPAVIVEFAQALILEKNRVKALECELNTAKPKAD